MYSFEHYNGMLGDFYYDTHDFVVTNIIFLYKAACVAIRAHELDESVDSNAIMLKSIRYQTIDSTIDISEEDYNDYLSDENVDYKHDCLCYIGNFEKTVRLPEGCIDTTGMFLARKIPVDVKFEGFDTGCIKQMAHMFEDCDLSAIHNFSKLNINTSNVTDMVMTFSGCKFCSDFEFGNNFNTSKVLNMYAMFRDAIMTGCISLNFDTSNVKIMREMFANLNVEDALIISLGGKFNTKNVINMIGMFYGINMRNKQHMMFDLGLNFNTSSVEDVTSMFEQAHLQDGFSLGDKFVCNNIKCTDYMFADAVIPKSFALPSGLLSESIIYDEGMFSNAKYPDNQNFDPDIAVNNFVKKKSVSKTQLSINDIFGF